MAQGKKSLVEIFWATKLKLCEIWQTEGKRSSDQYNSRRFAMRCAVILANSFI